MDGTPILSIMTYTPLIGALLLMFAVPKQDTHIIKAVATVFTLLTFGFSLYVWNLFELGTHEMQLVEQYSWIPSIGVSYYFGIDGISILLVMLTTIISILVVLCSYADVEERMKEYYVCILFLETGMLGVFLSLDFFLFYIFWEIMLVPMYFLIGIWGHGRKLYSAIKFFLYTLFGSVFMLLAILALYFLNGNPEYGTGELTFNVMTLMQNVKIPVEPVFAGLSTQDLIFLGLFLGFAIKVPMFPFHTWLPDAHTDAPTAGSVILAGVLLKMGTYGFLRFSLPMLPVASFHLASFVCLLAVIGVIYGALVAMAQHDMKRLVAYSSVSHMGFLMLGIFALNEEGVTGGLIQMINHGVSTGALFLLIGIIYEKRHTREISAFSGLSKVVPVFAVIFAITMFSSIGLPGLNGFVGEFLILLGLFKSHLVYAVFAVTGIVLGAAYMLWLFQRTMFGEPQGEDNLNMTDLNFRQVCYMLPLIILMFWIGLYPKPFLSRVEPTVKHYVGQVQTQHQAYLEATGQVRAAEAKPAEKHQPAEAHQAEKKAKKGEH